MTPLYLPVDPDFFDYFEKEKENDSTKVVYFGKGISLEEVNSKIKEIKKKNSLLFSLSHAGRPSYVLNPPR